MTWLVDETYVKIQGTWHYLYPGIDSDGQVLDCWLSRTRDLAAAEAFFRSTIGSTEWTPEHVVTDKATFYPSAIRAHAPYQAVPANSPKTEGFIDVFDPSTMRLVDTFPVPGCENGPTGLALGPNQKFLGACDNAAASVEVRHGQLHKLLPQVAGADEICSTRAMTTSTPGSVVLPQNWVWSTPMMITWLPVLSGKGGHSVAAYAGNNHIFDPDRAGTGIDVFVSSH